MRSCHTPTIRRRRPVEVRDAERRQRVHDRVADRRQHRHGAGLAAALHAERIGGAARAVEVQMERRQVVGARHRIVHERAGQHLAGLRVVRRMLQQRLADALRDRAMRLTGGDHRIDQHAVIVYRGQAHQRRRRRCRDRSPPPPHACRWGRSCVRASMRDRCRAACRPRAPARRHPAARSNDWCRRQRSGHRRMRCRLPPPPAHRRRSACPSARSSRTRARSPCRPCRSRASCRGRRPSGSGRCRPGAAG